MNRKDGVPAEDETEDRDDDLTEDDSEDTETDTEDETQDDDSEEVTDDSEEGEEKEDKSSSEDKTPIFFNPKDLPEQLKPVWQKMQASFTQKMQVAAAASKKAQAFENLVGNPRFRAWLEEEYKGVKPNTSSSTDTSSDRKSTGKGGGIRQMIREELSALVGPLQNKVAELDNSYKGVRTEKEFEKFESKYPFYEPYKEDMKAVLEENPALSFEQALAVVVFPDLLKKVGSGLGKQTSKKRANIAKPNRTSLKETTDDVPKSVFDAYTLAKKQLGMRR